MSDEGINPEDDIQRDDVLAAELSRGLLTGDELAQATRRVRIDQTFVDLVENCDIHFSTLTDGIAPVAPPKGVFKKSKQMPTPKARSAFGKISGLCPPFCVRVPRR
jgi:anti-sigma-K factor RskA